jgi:hypothetical protein
MAGRPSSGEVVVLGEVYLRAVGVARQLGVSSTQVETWWQRRARNGFPEGHLVQLPGRRTPLRVWDPEETWHWRSNYVPSRGGAPRGERNGSWRDGARRRVDEDGTRRRAS